MPAPKPRPRSLLPIQAAPVNRRERLTPAHGVDLIHGDPEALFALRMALLHGANYNDPAAWSGPAGGACCLGCLLQAT